MAHTTTRRALQTRIQLSPLGALRPLGRGLLTVPGLAPLPSVLCRWQLKISSARRRYLVIFSFTASHRSLLGSTVGGRGSPRLTPASPPTQALEGWGSSSYCLPSALHRTECVFMRLVSRFWAHICHLFLSPSSGWETSREGERKMAGEVGNCGHPQPTALFSWHPPPCWLSHPGKT